MKPKNFPKLRSMLVSKSTPEETKVEIRQVLNIKPPRPSLRKALIEFMSAIKSMGMKPVNGSYKLGIHPSVLLPDSCTNNSLISKDFKVSNIYFRRAELIKNKSTTEQEMLKTAKFGTIIEQINRLTKAILDKKIKGNMTVHAFLDKKQQTTSTGIALKLICTSYSDGQVSLLLNEVYPKNTWSRDTFWFSISNSKLK